MNLQLHQYSTSHLRNVASSSNTSDPVDENTCTLCEMPLVSEDHATAPHHAARAVYADAYLAYCAEHAINPADCGWNDLNNFLYRTFNKGFVIKEGSKIVRLKVGEEVT